MKPIFLHFSRLLAGLVFVYSGFVKGIDPLGSAYKFSDYFVAFNIEFLEPLSLPLSILLSSAEMLIGVLLLSGIHMILASWSVLFFMGFFTLLTLFIAITDPVADCGCFGDAIILTNWETFWKNVILMIFVVGLFTGRKKFTPLFSSRIPEWFSLAGFFIIIVSISLYSWLNLPVVDYRPFSTGTDILEKMSVPADAPADEYEITLYYRKDGITREFRIDEIPDSSWEWVRTESKLISKGYEPPISNFRIETVDGEIDHTYDILDYEGYTFIVISHDLDKSSEKNAGRINQLANWASANGHRFIGLTASPPAHINEYIEKTGATYNFYHSDEITLKTVIRSNPGLLLLKDAVILGKWHHRNIPHIDELKDNLLSWSLEQQQSSRTGTTGYGYILALLLVLLIPATVSSIVNRKVPGHSG